MHKGVRHPSSSDAAPKRNPVAGEDNQAWQIEALEPRLLLSGSVIDNPDDFREMLNDAGFGDLGEMGINVTMDVPQGYTPEAASAPEQTAAIGEAGLVDVGTQPVGALTGKIVYVHGGHGRYDNGSAWYWQRPLLYEQNEDMSNQDMMTYLVEFLWNSGATVVPLRPVGNQVNEVIVDNDDVEVTFVGAWSNSVSSIYYGDPGDTPYRYASTSATETAYARYRPDIPEAGFYPVYTWTRAGSDRVEQLYRVTHSGGTTEVSVNHKRVGNGLVYLGTYYFEEGTAGYVDISNRNNQSGVVIADMIRFGNGMGDINLGHGTSGLPREDEPGVYWIAQNLGQGISTNEYGGNSATVSAPPRFAEYMNREQDGSLSDRVFISYHSNAGSGSNRGTLGLVNGNNNPNTATPNQFLLANTVSAEINDDLVALNGTFEHNWFNRSTHTLDRSDIEFGEINNNYINNEFDATIIEWLFHNNTLDADLMRDPEVRKAVARATYQGLQKYFNSVDSGATGLTFLPDPVSDVSAETNGNGTVTVSWDPPTVTAIGGDAPTGYMVYTSLNGYGFDGGKYVAGGAANSTIMSGLDSANGTHYFKVVAVNAGGQSLGSNVVAATPLPVTPTSKVLIVNGFDRNDKGTNQRYTVPGGTIDRVRLRHQNTGDYVFQVAEAIEAFNPALGIDSTDNENIINGSIQLTDYDTVVWILGEESSADDTFSATEQSLVQSYVAGGGDLMVSGSEVAWDLDNLNNGRSFFNNVLSADYVGDDAGTHSVQGVSGSIFDGLSFSFDDGSMYYDAEFPDQINPLGAGQAALSYVGGSGGTAAIQKKGSTDGDIVMMAFPFEIITSESARADVMEAVLNFFGTPPSETPSAPYAFTATPGNNSVSLDWGDNVEPDLAGYNVYRANSQGGLFVKLNGPLLTDSDYTDNAVVNGTTYYYRVTAVDTDLNESAPSDTLDVAPDDHGDDKNTATPIATPSITPGQAAGVDDSDWFSVTLSSNTNYSISVLGDGLSGAQINFYTSGLTLITSDSGPASVSSLAEIESFVTFADTYFIEVVGLGGASGDYDLAIQETDDHGDDIPSATVITPSTTLGGIQNYSEPDFFRFSATEGMAYDISLSDFAVFGTPLPDATLTLMTTAGAVVLQDSGTNPGGTHAQLNWVASADTDMILIVTAGPSSLGDYTLALTESEAALEGDLNDDGFVGVDDLNIVLVNWNQNVTPGDKSMGDATGEGFVGVDDLNTVLVNWNNGTPPAVEATATSTSSEQPAAVTTQPPAQQQAQQQPQTQQQQSSGYSQQVMQAAWAQTTSQQQQTLTGQASMPVFGLWEETDEEDSNA